MTIEEELRTRIGRVLHDHSSGTEGVKSALERIMKLAEVALVLKARRVLRAYAGEGNGYVEQWARKALPLPTRTRQVLREEPVPGTVIPVFRVCAAQLEVQRNDGSWARYDVLGHNLAVMRHALDLYDNPYRTLEEPADETNPWPEVEP